MPKDRRERSVSFDRCRTSPYTCSPSHSRRTSPKHPSESEEGLKEWEEVRCPVCMEHPHNAILLICSSHEKGCRPYMCDTSYRHSNCFDQFRKSFVKASDARPQADGDRVENTNLSPIVSSVTDFPIELTEDPSSNVTVPSDEKAETKLCCPLCRGHVKDWVVVEGARNFMNSKLRSCACETCDFSGPYKDLRKHARRVHPLVRPSEADPERQRSWRRMERQRDLGDLLSTLQSSFGEERSDNSILPIDDGGWLTVFFLIRVLRPGSSSSGTGSWFGSRSRGQLRFRRRSTRLWGEAHDVETGSSSRDEDNDSSDGGSLLHPVRRRERTTRRRRDTPDVL